MKQYRALSAALLLLTAGCASRPPVVGNLVSLADAVAGAAASVEENAPPGGTVAVVKINAPLTTLSDFLAGELENRFTAGETLTVLARGEHLAGVNEEQQFQMSGMVNDENAAGIGRFLGAQVVITGDFTRFANFSQLALRAVEVETARLLTAYTAKIAPNDPVLAGITAPLGPATGWAVSEAELEQLNLAKDYIAAGVFDIAIEELDRLIAKNPNLAEAWYLRGWEYYYKHEKNRALADLTEAIRLDPQNAGYYIRRGHVYDDDDRAIADYTRAIRLDPHNTEAYSYRATLYRSKKDYDRAIADYTELIRLHPPEEVSHLDYAYTSRASLYVEMGDYDRAIADYTELIRLYPPDPEWNGNRSRRYFARAELYEKLSRNDQARADYNQAIQIDPIAAAGAYSSRAVQYADAGDFDRAMAASNQAVRLAPDDDYTYSSRGHVYAARGDYHRAIADYTEALRLIPPGSNRDWNRSTLYQSRARIYEKLSQTDRAIADYTEAIRFNPTNSFGSAMHLARGNLYFNEKKDYDSAIASYTEGINLIGDYTALNVGSIIFNNLFLLYANRGRAYDNKKDYNRAIADYEQALRMAPNPDPYLYGALGQSYRLKNDYDRAIAIYTEGINRMGDLTRLDKKSNEFILTTLLYSYRGSAYWQKKNYDRAIADFEYLERNYNESAALWRGVIEDIRRERGR
jgi:tetratricopeptide (TPR) repeat protein